MAMRNIAKRLHPLTFHAPAANFTTSLVLGEKSTSKSDGPGPRTTGRRRRRKRPLTWSPFVAEDVNENNEWSSVFQEARPFDPYVITMPIRMGRAEKGQVPPPAIGNLELMKIPNFFHLTPPAIHKHCQALKPLCTPWPKNLPHLPLSLETRNYVFPGHSVRHTGARKVVLTCRLRDLTLTERARNKMIQLAGPRYDPDQQLIRLVGKRCMTRKQNRDYVMYLLKRTEPWELEEEESNYAG